MRKRKRIYYALSAILSAGLAIAAGAWFLHKLRSPIITEMASLLNPSEESLVSIGSPDSRPLIDGSASAGTGDQWMTHSSLVMNLLKTSGTRESFGSYRLKGTIQNGSTPRLSRAVIEDLNTGKSRVYSNRESLPDNSQIISIQGDYITLQKNGVRKKLYVFSPYHKGIKFNTFMGKTFLGYKEIGANEFVLKPFHAFTGDVNRVLDFSMKVSVLHNRMEGIQITDIKDHALARELGLKEGDVLLEVNDQPINSLYKCFKASFNANDSDELQLKVRRGTQYIFLTYHLFWDGRSFWTYNEVLHSNAISSFLNSGFAAHLF